MPCSVSVIVYDEDFHVPRHLLQSRPFGNGSWCLAVCPAVPHPAKLGTRNSSGKAHESNTPYLSVRSLLTRNLHKNQDRWWMCGVVLLRRALHTGLPSREPAKSCLLRSPLLLLRVELSWGALYRYLPRWLGCCWPITCFPSLGDKSSGAARVVTQRCQLSWGGRGAGEPGSRGVGASGVSGSLGCLGWWGSVCRWGWLKSFFGLGNGVDVCNTFLVYVENCICPWSRFRKGPVVNWLALLDGVGWNIIGKVETVLRP